MRSIKTGLTFFVISHPKGKTEVNHPQGAIKNAARPEKSDTYGILSTAEDTGFEPATLSGN